MDVKYLKCIVFLSVLTGSNSWNCFFNFHMRKDNRVKWMSWLHLCCLIDLSSLISFSTSYEVFVRVYATLDRGGRLSSSISLKKLKNISGKRPSSKKIALWNLHFFLSLHFKIPWCESYTFHVSIYFIHEKYWVLHLFVWNSGIHVSYASKTNKFLKRSK